MSKNVLGADNQQATSLDTLYRMRESSETIRRAPISRCEIIAYLQGALHDATLNKSKRFRFSQKGQEWLKILKILLRLIGFNSWIYREGKNRDVYVLETLASFLDFEFNPLKLINADERKAYVRGFFDAEGGMPHSAVDRFYIQLVQNNKIKLVRIKRILEAEAIFCGKIHNPSEKQHPEYWRMFVLTNSHNRFVKEIGSLHPRKYQIFRDRMMI